MSKLARVLYPIVWGAAGGFLHAALFLAAGWTQIILCLGFASLNVGILALSETLEDLKGLNDGSE